MENLFEDLSRRVSLAEVLVNYLEEKRPGIVSWRQNFELLKEKSVVRMGVGYLECSHEEGFRVLEGKEKKFNAFLEGKVASREDEIFLFGEKYLKEIKEKEERLNDDLKSVCMNKERLEVGLSEVEGMRRRVYEKSKEIDCRERKVRSTEKLLVEKERELDRKLKSVEEREKMVEGIVRGLVQFIELGKSGHGLPLDLDLGEKKAEDLRKMIYDRFGGIGFHGDVGCEPAAVTVKEAESIRESLKQIDFVKIGKKLNSNQDEKEQLHMVKEELVKDAELRDKQLSELQKLGLRLVERLRLAENNLIGLQTVVSRLRKKKSELDLKEKDLASWENELDIKQKEISSAQESNELWLQHLDWKENNLNSVRKFTRSCFEEHRDLKMRLKQERESVEERARFLKRREEELENRSTQLELKTQELSDFLDSPVKIEPDNSADLKFIVKMNGKSLQMFLNDPNKDLESMGDEIFRVLHLSSDPVKLVLDAMEGFYPPHLRKGDVEFDVQRTCIHLLAQLMKMSPEIQPCLRIAAVEVALRWKSEMRITNPLEVLGFLHLLAAYNLAVYFDKDELLSFLTMVSQHRQVHELCHILGFTELVSGFPPLQIAHASSGFCVNDGMTVKEDYGYLNTHICEGPYSGDPKLHKNVVDSTSSKSLPRNDLPSSCQMHQDRIPQVNDCVYGDFKLASNAAGERRCAKTPSLVYVDSETRPSCEMRKRKRKSSKRKS